jgi:hypothetical protein
MQTIQNALWELGPALYVKGVSALKLNTAENPGSAAFFSVIVEDVLRGTPTFKLSTAEKTEAVPSAVTMVAVKFQDSAHFVEPLSADSLPKDTVFVVKGRSTKVPLE